jgi:hypothetical protein
LQQCLRAEAELPVSIRKQVGQLREGFTPAASLKNRLDQEAKACRALADKLVASPERDALLHKARQAETVSQFIKRAFSSPGLQRPK